jgi:hypothetical protein
MKKTEQIAVAIMHGMEIGLPPMQAIQRIAVINGRPSIWGDAIPALLWSRNFKIEEKELIRANTVGEVNGYECTITRPDGTTITRKFTEKDARDAGLWGKNGPWKQYPKRMLQMRARGLAARDGAADALAGLYLAEEAQDIVAEVVEEPINITPDEPTDMAADLAAALSHECFCASDDRPSNHAAKQNGAGDEFAEISGQVNDADTRAKLLQLPDLYSDEITAMPMAWASKILERLQERYGELEA